jgi:hypothetical protein
MCQEGICITFDWVASPKALDGIGGNSKYQTDKGIDGIDNKTNMDLNTEWEGRALSRHERGWFRQKGRSNRKNKISPQWNSRVVVA